MHVTGVFGPSSPFPTVFLCKGPLTHIAELQAWPLTFAELQAWPLTLHICRIAGLAPYICRIAGLAPYTNCRIAGLAPYISGSKIFAEESVMMASSVGSKFQVKDGSSSKTDHTSIEVGMGASVTGQNGAAIRQSKEGISFSV